MNSRILLSVIALTAGLAVAQPVNDTCAGAIPISPPGAFTYSRSPVTLMAGAATTPEKAFSCGASIAASAWYSFTPTVTGRYQLQTCPDQAPGGNVTNTVLAIYDGTCAALTEVAQGCDDAYCGSASRALPLLTAGITYYVQVAKQGAAVATDALQVTVNLNPAAENCSGPITSIPMNTTVPVSIAPPANGGLDDSRVGAMSCYWGVGNTTNTIQAAWPASGKDAVVKFTPPRDGRYSFRLGITARSTDSALYLTDSCTAAMTPPQLYSPPQCIAAANRFGSTVVNQEELSCVPLTGGTDVYLWIDEGFFTSTLGASFPLEVSDCLSEVEPNNTVATAGSLQCPLTASINPANDIDYFDLGIAPANARLFSMVEAGAAGFNQTTASSATNLQLRVSTSADTVIEFDNDDLADPFGSTAPGVAGTPLTAGVQHYLRVNHSFAANVVEPYVVYMVIQTATPVAESEPNDTPDQALAAPENYFSGITTANNDVDFFAFEARAGEVVYLALDSLPSRNGGNTGNHTLEIWGMDGKRLGVNDTNVASTFIQTTGVVDAGTPSSPSEHLVYRVPATGQYFARVGAAGVAAGTSNNYLLSISRSCSTGGGMSAPTITALSPVSGQLPGGDSITITGTNFGFAPKITFAGSPAQVISITQTSLVVRNPLGAEGLADVKVSTAAGSATLVGGFEYLAPIVPPTVTSISPLEGSIAGGQTVTINGTFFKPGAEVSFDVGGSVARATNVTIVNINRLTATTPANVEGDATITVRNPADSMEGSLSNAYRYNDVPRITAVNPATGLTLGGTTVTLTGSSFRPGAVVCFGAALAINVTVISPTSITLTTPSAAASGPVDLMITNIDSQSSVLDDGFSYVYPPPTVSSLTPARGPASGGTPITITGAFFLPAPTVLVGGIPATAVARLSATSITARTPPGSGVADVSVANFDGQATTATGAFTYEPPPSLLSIAPANGPIRGGTRVTITGQNFKPGVRLLIGGSPVMSAILTGDTTITGLTPSGPSGPADVEAINPDGQRAVLAGGFSWDAAPVITDVRPVTGSVSGGTVVTLTGANFFQGAQVLFGTQSATSVTVNSATELTAITPARAVGVVSITVRNTDGQQTEKQSAFRYVLPPDFTELSPVNGDIRGGTVTRLTGAGFGAQTTVKFGGVPSPLVTLIDSSHVDAVTPAHALGAVDVSVANSDGVEITLTGAFTFTRGGPEVISVAPLSGDVAGGSLITIVGSGFASGVTVTVGGTAATDVVLVSSELIRAVVPAHAMGAVDVIVTNDDAQSATAVRAFTYVTSPDGQHGLVTDGGAVALGEPPPPPTPWTPPSGCGCSSVEGSVLAFSALGMLLRRRRR